MDIFSVLALLGGLAVFLYGMDVMGDGLKRSAGNKLKSFLENVTSNPFKALMLGLGVTAVIQSSSATTVMVVGFINSGVMKLSQSVGIIMGANIGTSVTGWLLSLTSLESSNPFIQLLKASNLSYIVAVIGILLIMASKSVKKRDIGTVFLGFTLIIVGMEIMSAAVEPLKESPEFAKILTVFSNPILGILMGAVFTAIIQSSSASVGILQALSTSVNINYATALPIIMGQNIGTCITAMLAAIGTNKDAKRAAVIHLSFNIIGTIVATIIYYIIRASISPAILETYASPVGIAIVNTAFKLFSTFIMFPFMKQLEQLAYLIIKPENKAEHTELLDERLLATPTIAIAQSKKLTHKMAEVARESINSALDLIFNYDDAVSKKVVEDEALVDHYEDKLGSYLVKLSRESLNVEDSHEVANLLHSIGDFERISDHAVNIIKVAREINEKSISFSKDAEKEIRVMSDAIREIIKNTVEAFETEDLTIATKIEPLEQVVDVIKFKLKQRHIKRLQNGDCTIETGFVFSDFITNCERVADHCSNIAVCLIQVAKDSFETHEYLQNIKAQGNSVFDSMFNEYNEKYSV